VEGLTICTWRWGRKYGDHYVERLKAGVARHLRQQYRFAVFAPEAEDEYLTKVPGCFCRLRMFDPAWQQKYGLTGRIVSIDLDAIVTGPLDELFDRPEPFVILRGGNASNPCPFNGSMFMLRAGEHQDVWRDFSLKNAALVPYFEFPDDQAWLAHKLPKAAGWTAGADSGVYCFQKPGWPAGEGLPPDARLVAFPGWRDPSRFEHVEWVRRHWSDEAAPIGAGC
jgi:hypothetical protein